MSDDGQIKRERMRPARPARAGDWPPTAAQVNELTARAYPNRGERVVRYVRDLLSCIALILASLLMVVVLIVIIGLGRGLSRLGSDLGNDPGPSPTVTGCPFGDGQCGG